MNEDGLMVLSIVGLVVLFNLLPFIWVLLSGRSRGGAKFGWFLVVFSFSWLGLAAFLIVTQAHHNRPKRQSIITTGLQVSVALFLISLALFWLIRPDLQPVITPCVLERLGYRILMILTWPLERLNLPLWAWPLINLVQGFLVVFLVKLLLRARGRENVAA